MASRRSTLRRGVWSRHGSRLGADGSGDAGGAAEDPTAAADHPQRAGWLRGALAPAAHAARHRGPLRWFAPPLTVSLIQRRFTVSRRSFGSRWRQCRPCLHTAPCLQNKISGICIQCSCLAIRWQKNLCPFESGHRVQCSEGVMEVKLNGTCSALSKVNSPCKER